MTRRNKGFTLIELLVSIILMVILLSAVTLIFVRTTETVAVSQARVTVYTQARYALDMMENDLLGCLPFNNGTQRLILENGRTNPAPSMGGFVSAGNPTPAAGNHYADGTSGSAADFILFRATTSVGNTVQTAEVSYHLIPGTKALELPGGTSAMGTLSGCCATLPNGDLSRGGTLRPPYRPIYTLVRRVRVPDPTAPVSAMPVYNTYPKDASGNTIPDMELCYFVMSFNIEYLAADMSFSQIDTAAGLPGNSPAPPTDPLGDSGGTNDAVGTGLRLTHVRVTLVICEDSAARQERQIQKTLVIPMG